MSDRIRVMHHESVQHDVWIYILYLSHNVLPPSVGKRGAQLHPLRVHRFILTRFHIPQLPAAARSSFKSRARELTSSPPLTLWPPASSTFSKFLAVSLQSL